MRFISFVHKELIENDGLKFKKKIISGYKNLIQLDQESGLHLLYSTSMLDVIDQHPLNFLNKFMNQKGNQCKK